MASVVQARAVMRKDAGMRANAFRAGIDPIGQRLDRRPPVVEAGDERMWTQLVSAARQARIGLVTEERGLTRDGELVQEPLEICTRHPIRVKGEANHWAVLSLSPFAQHEGNQMTQAVEIREEP